MTAIQPTNSLLRDKIDSDSYTATLNEINVKYTEMDKFIGNLESDILSIKDFETEVLADEARGYDVGTSLDTLGFQKNSLEIDLDFFVHMKDVYIKKLTIMSKAIKVNFILLDIKCSSVRIPQEINSFE